MLASIWDSFSGWIASWFTAENRAKMAKVFSDIQPMVPIAIGIIAAIDRELKPKVKDAASGKCDVPIACLIADFIKSYSVDAGLAESKGRELQGYAFADLFFNVAVIVLGQVSPGSTGLSYLRTVVQFAYSVYQVTQNESEPADAVV